MANFTFNIKPAAKKKLKLKVSKQFKHILYCKPKMVDGIWYANINTKGFEGYKDKTVLPFTKQSLEMTGKTHIFMIDKDATGHWVHIIRDEPNNLNPCNEEIYSSLCPNSVFKGHIVKIDDSLQFDIIDYVGLVSDNRQLLTKSYSKEKEEDECDVNISI